MLVENKNSKNPLKDSPDYTKDTASMPAPYGVAGFGSGSYSKTNKLITALYMVTDIMDREEPLRNKLRTLGLNIISDTGNRDVPKEKTELRSLNEILSLLDIASAVGMISEMNFNILKKEFNQLKIFIQTEPNIQNNPTFLEEFFFETEKEIYSYPTSPLLRGRSNEGVLKNSSHSNHLLTKERGQKNSIGHNIGIQKGSTLLKAIKGLQGEKFNHSTNNPVLNGSQNFRSESSFDMLKRQRRDEIVKIIKIFQNNNQGNGATITDIKNESKGVLASCGEKTLQRELVSMVQDGVLEKVGEKRWSRYSVK